MKQYDYTNPLHIQEALLAAQQHRLITEQKQVSRIKKLLFFEKMEYMEATTYDVDGIDIYFIPADECEYHVKDDVLYIKDWKNKEIKINLDEDNVDTVVYAKSGYLLNEMQYLYNKFVSKNFIVLNNPDGILVSSDKYITARMLDEHGINQPKYALFSKNDCLGEDFDEKFNKKIKTIYGNLDDDNKYVCKILNGHGGTGVFLCNQKNILSILQCLFSIKGDIKILAQQKLSIKDGDLRAYVLTYGDRQEIVASITRKKAKSDFRTNISLGSTFEKIELTPEQIKFAKKVAKCTGLVFCGVDMCVNEDDGKLYVIEINGAPGAPVAIGLDDEQNHEQHAQYYADFTNKLIDILK